MDLLQEWLSKQVFVLAYVQDDALKACSEE